MLSPPRLIGQIAAEAATTEHQVKLALYLKMLADNGRTLNQAKSMLRKSDGYVRGICRRWLIDFPDYQPFTAPPYDKQGRPAPIGRLS